MSTVSEQTRITGLVSGLDSEALITAATANTKSAINSRQQKIQTLEWKQESYREIITAIQDFQDKYLSITSETSLRANAVMKANKAVSSNDSLQVTAGSSAQAGSYEITSVKTATTAKIGGTSVANSSVTLDFSQAEEEGNTVNVTLDGTTKEITFAGGSDARENFVNAVNDAFSGILAEGTKFEYMDDSSNKLIITNGDGDKVSHSFGVGYSDAVGLENETGNVISTSQTIGSIDFKNPLRKLSSSVGSLNYDFSINGVDFHFTEDSTVKEIMTEINNSDAGVKMTFSDLSQSFILESEETGAGQEIVLTQSSGNLLNSLFNLDDSDFEDSSYRVAGSNAQITVNGITLESNTNSFSIDGTVFGIEDVKDFTEEDIESGKAEAIDVKVSKDTSRIKETIVGFMEGYNELIDKIQDMLNTSRPKSSGDYYDPLTEEQEDEMDEDEIEKWNEKAKEGLLYHDTTLTKVLNSLKNAINTSTDGFVLQSMGITTVGLYSSSGVQNSIEDFGKLEFATDGEATLDAAIEKYGDKIADFFTNAETGLGTILNNAVNAAIDTSVDSSGNAKGLLTSVAGVENTRSETTNQIYKQIEAIQDTIDRLTERYESQQERLWDKYTALETYISNMNLQSQSLFGTTTSTTTS